MNANHMSGPWVASDYSSVVGSLISKGNHHIAAVLPQTVPEEAIANAQLIAAAPDLLAALETIAALCEKTATLLISPQGRVVTAQGQAELFKALATRSREAIAKATNED